MRHLGLFEGIGGFSLAARWMGWETVQWVEIDPFCQKVLSHNFPKAKAHGDIKTFKGERGSADIITAGVPCQPASSAGKRRGKEDDRWLWGEAFRVLREVKPRYGIFENVRGLLTLERGLVFDSLLADLEAEGYEVLPFLLPACAVNAPHRRDRIWIVAHAKGIDAIGSGGITDSQREGSEKIGRGLRDKFGSNGTEGTLENPHSDRRDNIGGEGEPKERGFGESVANATGMGRGRRGSERGEGREDSRSETDLFSHTQRPEQIGATPDTGEFKSQRGVHTNGTGATERHTSPRHARDNERPTWDNFPTQPPLCGGDARLSHRLDGITFPKWRKESIKAYGNAIVPQVALELYKVIERMS